MQFLFSPTCKFLTVGYASLRLKYMKLNVKLLLRPIAHVGIVATPRREGTSTVHYRLRSRYLDTQEGTVIG